MLDFMQDIVGIPLMGDEEVNADLYICKPNSSIPSHAHPNTETTIIYLYGDYVFNVGDQSYHLKPKHQGKTFVILPGVLHSGVIGPTGAAFISISRGLNKSTRALSDWVGETLGGEHANKID